MAKYRKIFRVGACGHQQRDDADWIWVKQRLQKLLLAFGRPIEGISCLAGGADQIFARTLIELGIKHVAVVPMVSYEAYFSPSTNCEYLSLRKKSKIVELRQKTSPMSAFLAAGKYVVDFSDAMIACWDEESARDIGGTADIVTYCLAVGRPLYILNPVSRRQSCFNIRHL
jgi:hypothetical protein